jgi:VacB/RNase II family 3'-5' exoribonuclease
LTRIQDRQGALSRGLAQIRAQYAVPEGFAAGVTSAAARAATRDISGHADWTSRHFVTLDPRSSTDLDQAFAIERDGEDIILHYAIADVGSFVSAGDTLDLESWNRGTTIYLPDGKAPVYPSQLSEGAASLLPGVERPAVVFLVRVNADGNARLNGAVRAIVCSRAKLAYETVKAADLPDDFAELSRRIEHAEDVRGAERVDEPEQEVVTDARGQFVLTFRPQPEAEKQNAAMSLAANLAVADALLAHRTGLFRVMPAPDERAINRLRHTARALRLTWPKDATLAQFERTLVDDNPRNAAFRSAVRRAGPGAAYAPYRPGVVPWHSAMAATYAHATAPLRRLADRYVVEAAFQVASGRDVDAALQANFETLPAVMARAESRSSQVGRAVLDLAEAVMLEGREGSRFHAVVTDVDERGARIQVSDPAVVARIDGKGAMPGDEVIVELETADVLQRQVRFRRLE